MTGTPFSGPLSEKEIREGDRVYIHRPALEGTQTPYGTVICTKPHGMPGYIAVHFDEDGDHEVRLIGKSLINLVEIRTLVWYWNDKIRYRYLEPGEGAFEIVVQYMEGRERDVPQWFVLDGRIIPEQAQMAPREGL